MTPLRFRLAAAVLVLTGMTGGIAGCDGFGSDGSSRITVKLTDYPFPCDDAEAAIVTVRRVELAGSDSLAPVVLFDSTFVVNLLDLRDGVTATLAEADLPQGDYSQLRFIVADDAAVVMKDSTRFDLKVPSGPQTGIKLNLPDFSTDGLGDEVVVTVDFNVENSFVVKGNPNSSKEIVGFNFKPVLKIQSVEINGAPVDTTAAN
ncbi:MAG: DUF4382 domain-containing protein [Rhodothermales bacterium]